MNYYYQWAEARGLTDEQATYIGTVLYDEWDRRYVAGSITDPPEYIWDDDDSIHGDQEEAFYIYDIEFWRDMPYISDVSISETYQGDHEKTCVMRLGDRYFQYQDVNSEYYDERRHLDLTIKEVYPYVVTKFAYANTPEEAYKKSLKRKHEN